MKGTPGQIFRNTGFTLIEIIVTLTIASVLAVVLIYFMQAGMSRSAEPLVEMQDSYGLNRIVENINADYRDLLLSSASPLMDLKTYIENGNDQAVATATGTPYYGLYLFQTKFITFDASQNETAAACTMDCKLLKVTLSKGGQSIATLFTK